MEICQTQLADVFLMVPKVFEDARGFFMETYRYSEMQSLGLPAFVQGNHSGSVRGTLRGLHYQVHQAQGKLIRAVAGEVYDVAVDIRPGSPTFGQWAGVLLSAKNRHMLWIPAGFAHGFLTISDWAEIVYQASDYYAPQWERTLLWNDAAIGVDWPLAEYQIEPLLSPKDAQGKVLAELDLPVLA
jgi:dTDP-4-dehydrorhamnose 3,5-epimerase